MPFNAIFSTDDSLRINPLARAQTLALVHFPELTATFEEFETASTKYTRWIYGAANKRISGRENFDEGFATEIGDYIKARNIFFEKLRDFGQRTFH